MARPRKHSARSIVLHQDVEIEATPVPFKRFDSVRQLDVARLSRAASARFELGYFDAGCCRRVMHAVVRKGKVVKLELEPCKERTRLTPELEKALQAVGRKLAAGRDAPPVSLPAPVSTFLAARLNFRFSSWWCIKICCFGHCLFCCMHIGGGPFWADCAIDRRPTPF